MKKMLFIMAHPDDESFWCGGTIAKYHKEKWHIKLISVTDGESGKRGSILDGKDVSLGETRRKELEKAAQILGIDEIRFLGKPDGGLRSLSPGTLEDPLYQEMVEYMPDIVVTHDTTGITNHMDHTKVSYAATYAFQKFAEHVSDLERLPEKRKGRGYIWKEDAYKRAFGTIDPANKDPKLYYVCMPEHVLTYLQAEKQMGDDSYGIPLRGTPDKFVTTVIDIQDTKLLKGKALLCHQTQEHDVQRFINFDRHPLHNQEYFMLRMQGVFEVFMGKTDAVSDKL